MARVFNSANDALNQDLTASRPAGRSNHGLQEFAIRRPRASDRAWEGDEAGPLVTYRSMATQVKYLWPLQAAIGDGDAQRKRLVRIRESLGWPVIGCNYLECFN